MQVTLKTLQQQTFKIDIDPEETVRAAVGDAGPRGRQRKRAGPAGPRRGAARGRRARLGPDGCGRRRGPSGDSAAFVAGR
jgi:hypothetical protein